MQSWREWCESFKQVEDYSFATLLRLDAGADYSEANTIIVTKVQFYAIELARNREGANDGIRGAFKPTPRKRKPVQVDASAGRPDMSEVERELQEILSGNHKLMK